MGGTELKPCPCCGGKAIIIQHISIYRNLHYYACCTECSMRTGIYKDKRTVKIQWNRRANNGKM